MTDNNNTGQHQHQHHLFHITGFGKFGGLIDNPATQTVNCLIAELEATTEQRSFFLPTSQPDKNIIVEYDMEILTVDIQSVENYFINIFPKLKKQNENIIKQYKNSTTTIDNDNNNVVDIYHHFIHIGVHGGIDYIACESTAYNNATFRIPDESQNTPLLCPIRLHPDYINNNNNNNNNQSKQQQQQEQECDGESSSSKSRFFAHKSLIQQYYNDVQQQQQQQKEKSDIVDNNNNENDNLLLLLAQHEKTILNNNITATNGSCLEFDSALRTKYNLSQLLYNTAYTMLTKYNIDFKKFKSNLNTNDDGNDNNTRNYQTMKITNNPGAFLCNYIYYLSLYYTTYILPYLLSTMYCNNNNDNNNNINIYYNSLFFHIPPAQDITPSTNMIIFSQWFNEMIILSSLSSKTKTTPSSSSSLLLIENTSNNNQIILKHHQQRQQQRQQTSSYQQNNTPIIIKDETTNDSSNYDGDMIDELIPHNQGGKVVQLFNHQKQKQRITTTTIGITDQELNDNDNNHNDPILNNINIILPQPRDRVQIPQHLIKNTTIVPFFQLLQSYDKKIPFTSSSSSSSSSSNRSSIDDTSTLSQLSKDINAFSSSSSPNKK